MSFSRTNQLFEQLDTNHDGVLSKTELAALQPRPLLGGSRPPGAPPQNLAMPRLGSPMRGATSPMGGGRPLLAPSMLNVGSPTGAYPMSSQPPLGTFGASFAASLSSNQVDDTLSPLDGSIRSRQGGRSVSPLPTLTAASQQNPRPLQSLGVSLDSVSPSNEPEKTFSRSKPCSPEASFEHKIEMLDQKENELQVLQMKMIAEQAQTFNREVAALRQLTQELQSDMATVRDSLGLSHSKIDDHNRSLEDLRGPHATADERIKYLETVVGDSLTKHDKLLKGLIDSQDVHGKDLADVKSATVHYGSFEQRMEYVEQVFGDSFDKHVRDLKTLEASHEKHLKDTEDIKAHTIHHASFEQRMDFLEKCIGDSAERQSKDLKDVTDATDKRLSAMGHASLPERMAFFEKLLGDSADKHSKELAMLRASNDKHANEIAGIKATSGRHANIQERLDYLEQIMGDSADKNSNELQDLKDSHARTHNGLQDLKDSHAKNVMELSSVKANQGNQVRMEDRVVYLEKLVGDSQSKHMQEFDGMKAHYNGYMARFDKQAGHHASLQVGLKDRIDRLEQRCGITADTQDKELNALKDAHGMHSKILEGLNLSTTDRLDAIERVLAFATDEKLKQTDEALKTTFNMYEQMRGR